MRRGTGDPEQTRAPSSALIGYVPDDVYLTTGPLYHSGPGGFMGVAFALGNTVVLQRKFDPEDWLRLVDDATASRPRSPRRRRSAWSATCPPSVKATLRPQQHEAHDRERRALVVRAEAALPRATSPRTRSSRSTARPSSASTRCCAGGPAAASPAPAGGRRPASRSRSSTTTGREVTKPNTPGRALRAQPRASSPPTTRRTRSTRPTGAATSTPSATSPTSTRRASTTSATARRT